eukprot:337814-Pelagomonas_calceolata.AAC.1
MVKAAQAPPSASSLFCTAERMTCRQACRCDLSLVFSWRMRRPPGVAGGPCPAALRREASVPRAACTPSLVSTAPFRWGGCSRSSNPTPSSLATCSRVRGLLLD